MQPTSLIFGWSYYGELRVLLQGLYYRMLADSINRMDIIDIVGLAIISKILKCQGRRGGCKVSTFA